MVTYSQLNTRGRLGNQLFQIASTIGAAKTLGQETGFPQWEYQHCFKNALPSSEHGPAPEFAMMETSADYSEINLDILTGEDKGKGLDMRGYFQSERYFSHAKEDVNKYFEFSDEILEYIHKKYSKELENFETSIHVRRGDYLKLNHIYHVQSHLYYFSAVALLNIKKAVIFSDDIEWCKTVFKDTDCVFINERRHDSYTISDTKTAEKDAKEFTFEDTVELALMSMFKNNIIANSTFSWWAAWLNKNKNKLVIAPKNWFAPDHINRIITPEKRNGEYIDDIIPTSWTKV